MCWFVVSGICGKTEPIHLKVVVSELPTDAGTVI